ncbi:MAG: hypothetical protein ACRDY6_12360 [Acidimicrobiia bacterium]
MITNPPCPEWRGRLTHGKTRKEALRSLKRRLSDVVFRQLVIDHKNIEALAD